MKHLRKYGKPPFDITVIHGGPGAAGEMAQVARELSSIRGVLEPFQTRGTIDGQVRELKAVLVKHGDQPVILIGHSWGAWLGYIFAAQYPLLVKKLILIGSGPFQEKYVSRIIETRVNRLDVDDRLKVGRLQKSLVDPDSENKDKIMEEFGKLMIKADTFRPVKSQCERLEFKYRIFQSIWQEASELRQKGILLEMGQKIQCPVIAIHGDYDSHPYEGIEKPLSRVIQEFQFVLLKDCGHNPWNEVFARDEFYQILNEEIDS